MKKQINNLLINQVIIVGEINEFLIKNGTF